MVRSNTRTIISVSIYANAFIIGGVLMGFEMLGSRYLYPYFGGGIGTWAALISVVLCALAFGYFIGGAVSGKTASPSAIACAVALSSFYMSGVPSVADQMIFFILSTIGDGGIGVIMAAAALLLIPLTLLGMFSPAAVRLLTHSENEPGQIAGFTYGVSTIGSVFGTLLTTFVLMPWIGSRAITYAFAGMLALSAASLFVTPSKDE